MNIWCDYIYAIHVILIVSFVCNSFLITNCNKKIMFFFLVPFPPLILFVRKKNCQMHWKLYQQKFNFNSPKAPHKKAFRTHLKQKKDKKPTAYQLGFSKLQPFTWHLGRNVEGLLAISCMLAKSFAQKLYSNSRKMNHQLWKKNQGTTQYWNVHQVLMWTMSLFFCGDKFIKHFSLEFQQLNWFCQVFDAQCYLFCKILFC